MRFIHFLFFVATIFICGQAEAASYCQWAGGMVVDGGEDHEILKIVVASVPRPKFPGHPEERPWCVQQRRALGGYQQMKLLSPPRNGEVRIKSYIIFYKGDRLGQDSFKIEVSWVGRNNEPYKGIINVDVNVVDTPF